MLLVRRQTMSLEKKIIKQLSLLDKNRKGFKYLLEAINISMTREGKLPLYKQVFPVIAKKYNVTAESVERDIRYVLRNQNCSTKKYIIKLLEKLK